MKKLKCKIVINAYKRPIESVRQAERLKKEFVELGVDVKVISDECIRSGIINGNCFSKLNDTDFIIYLDKDKYTSAVLSKLGVRLFNSHDSIRLCDDKAETYIALSNNGLKIPDTVFGALSYSSEDFITDDYIKRIEDFIVYPIVIKECFGSMGKGVYLVKDKNELVNVLEKVKNKPHLFQKYLPYKKGVDVRVIVIGGKAVSAIERNNQTDFRSNVARGGYAKAITLTEEYKNTAEKCAEVLGLDYCGVDLLYSENDIPYVCEVNSNAFFEGFESATNINVAKIYAEYIINEISKE